MVNALMVNWPPAFPSTCTFVYLFAYSSTCHEFYHNSWHFACSLCSATVILGWINYSTTEQFQFEDIVLVVSVLKHLILSCFSAHLTTAYWPPQKCVKTWPQVTHISLFIFNREIVMCQPGLAEPHTEKIGCLRQRQKDFDMLNSTSIVKRNTTFAFSFIIM